MHCSKGVQIHCLWCCNYVFWGSRVDNKVEFHMGLYFLPVITHTLFLSISSCGCVFELGETCLIIIRWIPSCLPVTTNMFPLWNIILAAKNWPASSPNEIYSSKIPLNPVANSFLSADTRDCQHSVARMYSSSLKLLPHECWIQKLHKCKNARILHSSQLN